MNTSFSVEKAIHVLSYLQQKTGVTDVRILLAYAFLADRYSIRTYAMPVLGEPHYYATESGPVPLQTMRVLEKDLIGTTLQERALFDSSIRQTSNEGVVIDTLQEYDLLSRADIEALDFASGHFKGLGVNDLVALTQQYPEWVKGEMELTSGSTMTAMCYEDFFDNPAPENLQEIHRILGYDDPFITHGPGTAVLALAKDVFLCS